MASSKIKGITIVIGGETTNLQKALKDVDKQVYGLNDDLKGLNKALKLDPSNIELLAQKQDVLQRNIQTTTDRLNTLKEAQRQMGDYNKLTDEQKTSYNQLSVEISKAENALNGMNKELEETKTSIAAGGVKNVKDNVEDLGKASLKTGDIIKANLISQAIITGVKKLGSVFSQAVNTLNNWSQKAKELEEQEAKVVRVMKNTTNATDEQINSLIKLTSQQEKLGVVSQETQLAGLQELGTYVTQKESLEKLLPVMNDMIAQQYGLGASMESASGIATMMGKVLGNGQVDALSRLGYKFDEAQKKILKYGKEEEKVAMLSEIIQQSVGGMNKALGKTDAGQLQIASSYFEDMQKKAGKAFTTIKAKLTSEFLPSIKKISEAFEQIIDGTLTLEDGIKTFSNVILDAIKNIGLKLPSILEKSTKTIIQILPKLLDTVLKIILEVGKELGNALPTLIPILVEGLLNMVDTILDNIDLFINAAIELVKGLAIGLIKAIPVLIDKIPTIIDKLINAILDNLPKIIETGFKLFIELGAGIIKAIPDILKKIPELITKMVNKFKEYTSKFVSIGVDMVKGIWDGVKRQWDVITTIGLPGIIDLMMYKIKQKLGIASPSKVMRNQIGKNIGLGLAAGINDTVADVEEAMQNLSSGIETSVNPTINPTANTNPLYINIDNFYNNRETDVQQLAEELEFYRKNSALAKGGV